ncbi:hypothetical protein SASPL_156810 [Salvia splendens]|uniref:Cyclin N-terminal domain-containing protein n=1 Tax=Salvia splendens TaxID=180675 RepID=A0A8X8VW74_SALSN|nr:hypothetical protein SASPL_156810 [Salvia splendens]
MAVPASINRMPLSLAAKMEELHVPCLLELQSLERIYIFEPKTIQRMELLILTTLDWRLRSVTHRLITSITSSPCFPFLLRLRRESLRRLRFNPQYQPRAEKEIFTDFVLLQEMVRSCHQLMEEYLLDTCLSSDGLKAAPPSPHGVLDAAACASCDTNSENQAGSEPQNKRPRLSPPDVQES